MSSIALISTFLFMAQPVPVIPEGMERAVDEYHYSPAVISGDEVFLSGVVAGVPGYNIEEPRPLTDDEIALATDQAFKAIGKILHEAGTDWEYVIELTTFHTNLHEQIGAFATTKDNYIKDPYPTWTAIDIDRLYPDEGIIEIKVCAKIPLKK